MRLFTPIRFACRLHAAVLCVANASFGATANATGEGYTPPPFGHYQPILDRMPFGSLPANFNAVPVDPSTLQNEAQLKAEQQAVAKKINMSAVNVTPDGSTAIGFTDLSVTPPVSYYLRVGESSGGWAVLNADYDTEIATIEKDAVTITIQLGKGLVDTNAMTVAALKPVPGSPPRPPAMAPTLSPAPAIPSRMFPQPLGGVARPLPTNTTLTKGTPSVPGDARSYAERLRDRTTQKTQEQVAADKKLQEQFEKLARDTATREIKRREEEAALAAQEEQALRALEEQQQVAQPQMEAQQQEVHPQLEQ